MNEATVLTDIRERLVRLETKIDTMTETKETAAAAKQTANEALQSSKSSHHRLDKIEDNQRWLWRTVIGSVFAGFVSLITGIILFFIKGNGAP